VNRIAAAAQAAGDEPPVRGKLEPDAAPGGVVAVVLVVWVAALKTSGPNARSPDAAAKPRWGTPNMSSRLRNNE
jgi:hypothetical protein